MHDQIEKGQEAWTRRAVTLVTEMEEHARQLSASAPPGDHDTIALLASLRELAAIAWRAGNELVAVQHDPGSAWMALLGRVVQAAADAYSQVGSRWADRHAFAQEFNLDPSSMSRVNGRRFARAARELRSLVGPDVSAAASCTRTLQ